MILKRNVKGEKCMKRVTRWFDKTHAILVDAEENPEVRYATEKLAKYEDLEEQGRLIKLSCNKEDTVYDVDKVVEQLKTDSSVKLYGSGNSDNYLIPVKRAINIVKAAAPNDSNFKNDKDVGKLCEGYMQQGYNQAILDFIHELDNYCGYYEGKIKNLTRDGVLEVAEQLRKKLDNVRTTIEEVKSEC